MGTLAQWWRATAPVPLGQNVAVPARAIVLAGPSGSGKSHLAARLGLPVLRLDDFYREGTDPALPRIAGGANAGLVDWDHPDSWLPDDALSTIAELCAVGRAEVPVYDIARNGRHGSRRLELQGSAYFVAEGIFAHEIVAPLRERDQLAAAYCVTQHPVLTFGRRLVRDLRERRKPPMVLLRRGVSLMRAQDGVVEAARVAGCEVIAPDHAYRQLQEVMA
jgi:uridine kinase